jgi:threonine dehydratase
LSWKKGRRVEAPLATFAEGLATRVPFDLPQAILRRDLDDFILVSDDEIRAAMRSLIEQTRNLVEAAGAAPLAAARKIKERITGRKVVLIVTGANVTLEALRELLLL